MKKAKTLDDLITKVIKALTDKQLDKFQSFDDLYDHVFKVIRKDLLRENKREN
jgi:hypothetical protein